MYAKWTPIDTSDPSLGVKIEVDLEQLDFEQMLGTSASNTLLPTEAESIVKTDDGESQYLYMPHSTDPSTHSLYQSAHVGGTFTPDAFENIFWESDHLSIAVLNAAYVPLEISASVTFESLSANPVQIRMADQKFDQKTSLTKEDFRSLRSSLYGAAKPDSTATGKLLNSMPLHRRNTRDRGY
jgi:hypothetical protein